MTEAVRRVTFEAELPEDLAAEIDRAVQSGEAESPAEVVEDALYAWSYERWGRDDPEGWRAHVNEVRGAIADADADPGGDVDASTFFAELRGELERRESSEAMQAAE